MEEVLFERRGRAGFITLNRPRALNAVTLAMIRKMRAGLSRWANDEAVERVVIRANGEKAFSAGGDIRQLYEWMFAGDPLARTFYAEEYRLNAFIKRYPKPYVALVDGIVMGGGVGVSFHGSHSVCGESTRFAMPETGIGFFPDVGATFFLPRLPGKLGSFLALTGARLGQADLLWCGLATHAVPRMRFDALADALAEAADLEDALARFSESAGEPPIAARAPAIDRCFGAATVENIVERLSAEGGEHAGWAKETLGAMAKKSPLNQKIALRQMQVGAAMAFEECMRTEFRLAMRAIEGGEFREGIRAAIVDKDNSPRWSPARLEDVTDDMVDRFFAPLDDGELQLP